MFSWITLLQAVSQQWAFLHEGLSFWRFDEQNIRNANGSSILICSWVLISATFSMYMGRKLGCKQSLSFEEVCFNWYPLAAVPPVSFASDRLAERSSVASKCAEGNSVQWQSALGSCGSHLIPEGIWHHWPGLWILVWPRWFNPKSILNSQIHGKNRRTFCLVQALQTPWGDPLSTWSVSRTRNCWALLVYSIYTAKSDSSWVSPSHILACFHHFMPFQLACKQTATKRRKEKSERIDWIEDLYQNRAEKKMHCFK